MSIQKCYVVDIDIPMYQARVHFNFSLPQIMRKRRSIEIAIYMQYFKNEVNTYELLQHLYWGYK